MSYQEFIGEVLSRLKTVLPQNTELKIQKITKNNLCVQYSLCAFLYT